MLPTVTTVLAEITPPLAEPSPRAQSVNLFLLGAIVLAALAIAVIFLRSWRKTRDGLFLMFAVAFSLMAVTYAGHAIYPAQTDRTVLYALRLASYAAIVVGIIVKNRAQRGG